MMNGLMFYYIYINLSVILYHTLSNIKLIFIKYFRLYRLRLLGIGEGEVIVDAKYLNDKLTKFMNADGADKVMLTRKNLY